MPNDLTTDHGAPVRSLYADDPDFQELLEIFADRLEKIRAEFVSAFSLDDREALLTCAHRLKGSAGGYGFREVSEAAGRLERVAREGTEQTVSDAWSELSVELKRVEAGFAPAAEGFAPAAEGSAPAAEGSAPAAEGSAASERPSCAAKV